MADHDRTPRASDDLETAERKSRSVDERLPERQGTDRVPELELPGTGAAFVPQSGIGRDGPFSEDREGPGEQALEQEAKAQRTQPRR